MTQHPLTHRPTVFAIRHRLRWDLLGKPLTGLSWLRYSPSGFCNSPERRTWSEVRFRLSPGRKLPTPANVVRALAGTRTRIAFKALTLTPLARFTLALPCFGPSPTPFDASLGFSLSPLFVWDMDRVERRDCSAAIQRHSALLQRAPVELGEQVSLHPALRVDTAADGKFRPLRTGW
jgi:hypothetical protein